DPPPQIAAALALQRDDEGFPYRLAVRQNHGRDDRDILRDDLSVQALRRDAGNLERPDNPLLQRFEGGRGQALKRGRVAPPGGAEELFEERLLGCGATTEHDGDRDAE